MKQNFNLKVSNPCAENFSNFKATESGGFCNSCKKDVIDFSKMTDKEVIDFFKYRNEKTCGRFNKPQLKTYVANLTIKHKKGFSGLGFSLLLAVLFTHNTKAQDRNTPTVITQKKDSVKTIPSEKNNQKYVITGNVSDDVEPFPGVSIVLKNTTIGTETDFDGNFTFPKPLKTGDVLIFSYIGFDNKEITIKKNESFLKVILDSDSCMLMGEVEINKTYTTKRSFWDKIKSIF